MEGINILDALAVLVCACVSAMGLGGGGVLILYLTLVRDTPQMLAQGVNLLFFLPCAVTAAVVYQKRGLLRWGHILPLVLGGLLGVGAGSLLLRQMDTKFLTVAFAALMIGAGLYTVFSREKAQ